MVFINMPSKKRAHRPWLVPLLVCVILVVYAWLHWHADPAAQHALVRDWLMAPLFPNQVTTFWHEPHALHVVTALFVHDLFWPLLINVLFLIVFGMPTERILGPWRLLSIFILGGAITNLCVSFLSHGLIPLSDGASGALSAIIGAYLVSLPKARLGIVVPLGIWPQIIRAPASALIIVWVLAQVFFSYSGPAFGAIGGYAQIAGFISGVLLALLFKPFLPRHSRWH